MATNNVERAKALRSFLDEWHEYPPEQILLMPSGWQWSRQCKGSRILRNLCSSFPMTQSCTTYRLFNCTFRIMRSIFNWLNSCNCCCATASPSISKDPIPIMALWQSTSTDRMASLHIQSLFVTSVLLSTITFIDLLEKVLRSFSSVIVIYCAAERFISKGFVNNTTNTTNVYHLKRLQCSWYLYH